MAEQPDTDPASLGRYRVVGRLGVGGMGRVLLGVDEIGRRVALKVVHPELAADAGFRERFRREIQIAAAAPPWFTAPVLDADPDAELPWLATAYVEGPSLRDYVAEQGPLDEFGVAALAVRMADGLVALHKAGLVHRDLKPSNVLLAEDGPRLIDFGISRAMDNTALTQTGHVIGTPEYMSPEQASGERDIGPASDMFSFGTLIGYAANGRSPFESDSSAGALYRVVYSDPDFGKLTGRTRDAIAGCLNKDPAARPTAVQVRGMLRAGEDPALAPTVAVPGPLTAPAAPPPPTEIGATAHMQAAPPAPRRTAEQRALPGRLPLPVWIGGAAVLGALLTLVVVLFVNGRGGGGGGGTLTPSTAGATSAQARPTPVAPTTAAIPDLLAGATILDGTVDVRYGSSGNAIFQTPSHNIACSLDLEGARCDVAEKSWQVPPRPADCPNAYGNGATLTGTTAGSLSCAGDTMIDPAHPVLPYKSGVKLGDVACVSQESGLSCQNTKTKHGFTLSRDAYKLY